jgi:hypothetical protein
MGKDPQLAEIASSTDLRGLVQNQGKTIDRDGKTLCPFHDDHKPSCHIYEHKYKCFACGATGDVFDWLRQTEGLDIAAAKQRLGHATNGQVHRKPTTPAPVTSAGPTEPFGEISLEEIEGEPAKPPKPKAPGEKAKHEATYQYRDNKGEVVAEVIVNRYSDGRKDVFQRRRIPAWEQHHGHDRGKSIPSTHHAESWAWGMTAGWYQSKNPAIKESHEVTEWKKVKGATSEEKPPELDCATKWLEAFQPILYNLHELKEGMEMQRPIYICEGEKSCDAISALNQYNTTNLGGAGKWPHSLSKHFTGAHIIIIQDRDEPGERHARDVYDSLRPYAASIKIVQSKTTGKGDDVVDHLAAGYSLDELEAVEIEEAALTEEPSEEGPLFPLLTWQEAENLPPKEWLIQGVLGVHDLCVIYGQPSTGKSFTALDMACCLISTRRAFAGNFFIEPGTDYRVVYCVGEKSQGFSKRMRAARNRWALTEEETRRFTLCTQVPQLYLEELETYYPAFIEAIREGVPGRIDAIFIDTKHRATIGSDENSSRDAGKEIHACYEITQSLGSALILVHHSAKGSSDLRGSSAWRAACDSVFEVSRTTEGGHRFKCEKMGDAEDGWAYAFDLPFDPEADSLSVQWIGSEKASIKSIGEQALEFLKEHAGRRFARRDVKEKIVVPDGQTVTENAVGMALERMAKNEPRTGIRAELLIPGQEKSKANPWVYSWDGTRIQYGFDEEDPS